MEAMIEARGLAKSYHRKPALADVGFTVPPGSVLGLLGPNGAGKTTTVRILSTLLRPDQGNALIAGHDVTREPVAVRRAIGLVGQHAAIDQALTARENLHMVARLYRLSRRQARTRTEEALELLGLTEAADHPARTYSGGMRRRLDLGASLVGQPPVLLLDEPTSGLDPAARIQLWQFVRSLVDQGTTLLLTTQAMEEADQLASHIIILDRGRIAARGTPGELKARLGDAIVDVTIADPARLADAAAALAQAATTPPVITQAPPRVSITAPSGADALVQAVRQLDEQGIGIADVMVRRPTLDDVFLAITGHATLAQPNTGQEASA